MSYEDNEAVWESLDSVKRRLTAQARGNYEDHEDLRAVLRDQEALIAALLERIERLEAAVAVERGR